MFVLVFSETLDLGLKIEDLACQDQAFVSLVKTRYLSLVKTKYLSLVKTRYLSWSFKSWSRSRIE